MKKVHLILTGCALSLAMSSALAATTTTTTRTTTVHTMAMHQGHCPVSKSFHHYTGMCHKWSWIGSGTIVRYGYLTPEQKTWFGVPATATPGARGVCWSNVMEGKVKVTIPNYGKVVLTPNNPLVAFAVPQQGFYAEYCTKAKSGGGFPFNPFRMFFGSRSDNTAMSSTSSPVFLTCKFN